MNPEMKDVPIWVPPSKDKRPPVRSMIKALKEARDYVKNTMAADGGGICFGLPDTRAGNYLCCFVMAQLGNNGYLNGWLRDNYPDEYVGVVGLPFKEARLMWIDWMIASLQDKEYKP